MKSLLTVFQRTAARLRAVFRRGAAERDMTAEMQAHLEMQEQAHRAAGLSSDEARYAARRQFGNVAQVQERAREQRGWMWLEQLTKDFQLAGRTLARTPGFTAAAVLLLALGVGGNTIIFSLVNGLYLKALPFPDAGRLVDLDETAPQWNLQFTAINYDDFAAWRAQNQTFVGMAVWKGESFNLVAGQTTVRVQGQRVSHDLAAVFGVDTGIRSGSIDKDHYRHAEFFRKLHHAQCLTVPFGMRAAEIAHHVFFGVTPFLVAFDCKLPPTCPVYHGIRQYANKRVAFFAIPEMGSHPISGAKN